LADLDTKSFYSSAITMVLFAACMLQGITTVFLLLRANPTETKATTATIGSFFLTMGCITLTLCQYSSNHTWPIRFFIEEEQTGVGEDDEDDDEDDEEEDEEAAEGDYYPPSLKAYVRKLREDLRKKGN